MRDLFGLEPHTIESSEVIVSVGQTSSPVDAHFYQGCLQQVCMSSVLGLKSGGHVGWCLILDW